MRLRSFILLESSAIQKIIKLSYFWKTFTRNKNNFKNGNILNNEFYIKIFQNCKYPGINQLLFDVILQKYSKLPKSSFSATNQELKIEYWKKKRNKTLFRETLQDIWKLKSYLISIFACGITRYLHSGSTEAIYSVWISIMFEEDFRKIYIGRSCGIHFLLSAA